MESTADQKAVFKSCTRFVRGHYPLQPLAVLASLSAQLSETGDSDYYGKGELIESFESEIALLLGKESAVFMPSGTMAQLIALRIWSDRSRNPKVGLHPTSHLELHEHRAYQHLHDLKAISLGERSTSLIPSDLQQAAELMSSVLIELPQRELGGTLPAWESLNEMAAWAKKTGTRLHMDGARLWEAQPYYARSHADICAHFDSVYVSFYKGLGGIAGAILAGPSDFIVEAKIWQRRQGGNLHTLFPYILSAKDGLKMRLSRMHLYHQKALEVARVLSEIPGIEVHPNPPHANMMHVFLRAPQVQLESAAYEIAKNQRISVFTKIDASPIPGIARFELAVGDATLDFSNDELSRIFHELMDRALR